jgi:hypothetical protein
MICQTASRALARFLLCVLVIPSAFAGVNTWTVKGPPGGLFTDIEVSPTDSNVLFATYARSLFRSTDGGVTWQVIREFIGEAEDLSIDPTDGNRVYVAVLDEGLFRTENGGQSFQQIAPALPQIWSVGAADDGQTVYYADASGDFFRSTDRGQNWVERTSTGQTVSRIQIEPGQPDVLMAFRGPFLMRSANGATSWVQSVIDIDANLDSIYSVVRLSPTVLVATTQDGLYQSIDDGGNWTQKFPGWYTSAVADPAVPGTVYAAASGPNQALLRSVDFGANWISFGAAPLGITRRIIAGPGTRFIVANGLNVQRSVDSGATWTEATSPPIASGPSALATTLAANSKVYAHVPGDGDGLYVMSGDSAWQRIDIRTAYAGIGATSAQTVVAVKPGIPDEVYMGVFGAGITRSANGGTSWTASATPFTGFGIHALGFAGATGTIYAAVSTAAATPAASIYRSLDDGAHWAPHSLNLPDVQAFRLLVDPADANRMFLAALSGTTPGSAGLYRSTDAGLNWTRVAFASQPTLDVEIDPSDENVVYAATSTGLHVSTNGGDAFTENTAFEAITSLPARAIAIDPVVPTTLYAASIDTISNPLQKSSWILRSVDSGQSWETLRAESAEPRFYVTDLTLDPNLPTQIYAATGVRGVAAFEIVNDLAIGISGHAGLVPKGVPAAFEVRIENDSSLAATAVSTIIDLPAGLTNVTWTPSAGSCSRAVNRLTCGAGVLRAAQPITIGIAYTPPDDMALPVAVSVSAHERDTTTANNAAQATASAGEVVDLAVTLTPSPSTVNTGSSFSFAAQVSNSGPIGSSGSTLTLTPPAGITLGTLPAGCSTAGGTVTCAVGALAVGASTSFSIPATAASTGTLATSASIAVPSAAHDPNAANNAVTANVVSNAVSPPGGGGGGGGGSSGGGGGGGALDLGWLLLGLALLAERSRRKSRLAQAAT